MLTNISCDEYDNLISLNFNQFSDLGAPFDLLEAKEFVNMCGMWYVTVGEHRRVGSAVLPVDCLVAKQWTTAHCYISPLLFRTKGLVAWQLIA